METVGFIGVGKIGLPISENLIKSGYRVLGYRRSSLADFEKIGGVPAHSPAEIGEQTNFIFSCVFILNSPAACRGCRAGAKPSNHMVSAVAIFSNAEKISE